jgi:hypothetical protein
MLTLSYKPIGAQQWVPFFADSNPGQTLEHLNWSGKNIVSAVPGFGAANQSIVPLGNSLTDINWKLLYVYANPGAAASAVIQLYAALNGQSFHLQVQVGSGGTQTTAWWPNCALEGFVPDIQGQAVELNLQIKAQALTTTQPTT